MPSSRVIAAQPPQKTRLTARSTAGPAFSSFRAFPALFRIRFFPSEKALFSVQYRARPDGA